MRTQYESGSARYRFQSGEYSPSTQGTGPPHGISLRKHNPPADGGGASSAGGPDRPGPRGSAAVLISGMKNPGLSRKSDVHKRLYLVPPFFGTGETIPASKRMPLSISTLKFRACKNCEQGFDNHKRF